MPSYAEFVKQQAEKQKVDGAKFVEKYKPLVEDIRDEYLRTSTAILLENQVNFADKFLMSESTSAGSSIGTAGQFIKYALPIIRRVFPNLIANKLVGVQPLMQAVGFIFYLRYKMEQGNRGQTLADTQMNLRLNTTGATPGTGLLDPFNVSSPYRNFPVNPYYSKQLVSNQRAVNATGAGYTAAAFLLVEDGGAGTWVTPALPLQTTAPAATAVWQIKLLEMDETNASFNVVRAQWTWDGTTLTNVTNEASPHVTLGNPSYNTTTRVFTLNVTGSTCATDSVQRALVVDYIMNLEANSDIAELKITIDKDTVEAKTRKLKTVWTPESAQDFKSYHGIDVEAELTALMSQEVALEIDREIIADLLTTGAQVTHDFDQGAATNYNYLDRHVALMQRILLESNNIMRDTLRGKANWLVTSPEIASILEVLKEFKPYGGTAGSGLTNAQEIGARGTLMGSLDVFVDPLFPKNKILLGYKGPSVVDSGYFYAPYIPLELTPVVLDPYDFTPRRGALTRYATKLIERGSFYYRTIRLRNSASDENFDVVS